MDPSANGDSQTETMSNATQGEGSKTDRQGLLNIKAQWNLTLHIFWQAASVKKDEFLDRVRTHRSPGVDLERRDLEKSAFKHLATGRNESQLEYKYMAISSCHSHCLCASKGNDRCVVNKHSNYFFVYRLVSYDTRS